MPLHISLESIVEKGIIESNRVEYKSGWNPLKALRTICAFANDMDDVGGGYIVIGLKEEDGRVSDVVGLSASEIREIENDLMGFTALISPRYTPVLSVERYRGKDVAVIWAPCGAERPYRCAVSLSKGNRDERRCFIRRLSHTVAADSRDELFLMAKSNVVPYDVMVNPSATLTDLSRQAIVDYLDTVKSDMDYRNLDLQELCIRMGVAGGPREDLRPLNVGLLMFCWEPERFFPYARIEVVIKPDPTGDGMVEKIFRGPVHIQLTNALNYIRDVVIEEKIFKVSYQAQALRAFNYPFEAIEETLVNAVYHKDYRIPEPIVVTITKESVVVVSFPGPDPSISDDDMADCDMVSAFARNRRLGDFLKELRLTEGRNTGIPKVCRAMERNGSDRPMYRSDPARRALTVTLPVHRFFRGIEPNRDVPEPSVSKHRSGDKVKGEILDVLARDGCLPGGALARRVGYSSVNNAFRRYIAELMDSGLVTYLYPDSPKHPKQRICLVMEGEIMMEPVTSGE